MAIQRVRKKRWAITMPRQRAAISLQIVATREATARAAAAMPRPPGGAGPPGGPNKCGTGGRGASDKLLPQNCGGILFEKSGVGRAKQRIYVAVRLSRKS